MPRGGREPGERMSPGKRGARELDDLDLKAELEKPAYKKRMPRLRDDLRNAQLAIRAARIPVVVVFEGWDASGKGDSIGSLTYPMDPRGFKVYTTQEPNEEERYRPFLWRFSTRLPARGDFAFFDRSWYRRLLEERVDGAVRSRDVKAVAAEIRDFERGLIDEGTVLVKFWLHISKKEQARRFMNIESDRYERWRVTQADWKRHRNYKKYQRAADQMLDLTSMPGARWNTIEATDPRHRRVRVFEVLLDLLRKELQKRERRGARDGEVASPAEAGPGDLPEVDARSEAIRITARTPILDRVDLSRRLTRPVYEKRLDALQARLRDLGLECHRQRLPVVIVYEGWDASGKGGNIKRLTQELDPRGYEVISIAAPDETEKAHHYLWRFWRQLPKAGHIGIFDRSWYGRVLVERVEGFASEAAWRRAYGEINEFERHLAEFGAVVVKFWIHLSPEEQLRRLREREKTPYKRHKITAEDWRNRAKWNLYKEAVAEMLERTSTKHARWTIVEGEDKLWARVKALATVVSALERRLEGKARARSRRGLGGAAQRREP
jgi:AMP-polyphosphate phosphotransferase